MKKICLKIKLSTDGYNVSGTCTNMSHSCGGGRLPLL